MKYERLVALVGDEPVFETGLLLAGDVDPRDVRRQLSRWAASGRIYQLRRGLYCLAAPFQKVKPHPFLVANRMVRGSYASMQSALAFYGMIPEHVPVTTSLTTARPARWETPLGIYEFHHVKLDMFFGYKQVELSGGQTAFMATPEKALLDTIYLQPGGDKQVYLNELRLQNLDVLDLLEFRRMANQTGSPKLLRGADVLNKLVSDESRDYEIL